jgi:hypothetical protein
LEAQVESCQCQGLEKETKKWVLEDLALYRKGRLAKTTPMLINALLRQGVEALSLLDIGGGLGIVQIELLRSGQPPRLALRLRPPISRWREAARASMEHRITTPRRLRFTGGINPRPTSYSRSSHMLL